MTDMTVERAQEIAAELVAMRVKWGNNYQLKDHPAGQNGCLDAIVCLAKHENVADAALRGEITLTNRQLGASKSRETKYKKQIEDLKGELKEAEGAVSDLMDQAEKLQHQHTLDRQEINRLQYELHR